MLKIKKILHWLYMFSPSILIFVLYGKIKDNISLVGINIPKWLFLVFAIVYVLFIIYTIIVKFAVRDQFEEVEDYSGLKKYLIAESLHYTFTELIICLSSIICLTILGSVISSWSSTTTIFGIVILLIYGFPFLISIFSVFSINKEKLAGIETQENLKLIQRLVVISGIVSMFTSIINLSLSLIISSMMVCSISYLVLIPTIIFEIIFYTKNTKKIYAKEEKIIDENEKKERIA